MNAYVEGLWAAADRVHIEALLEAHEARTSPVLVPDGVAHQVAAEALLRVERIIRAQAGVAERVFVDGGPDRASRPGGAEGLDPVAVGAGAEGVGSPPLVVPAPS